MWHTILNACALGPDDREFLVRLSGWGGSSLNLLFHAFRPLSTACCAGLCWEYPEAAAPFIVAFFSHLAYTASMEPMTSAMMAKAATSKIVNYFAKVVGLRVFQVQIQYKSIMPCWTLTAPWNMTHLVQLCTHIHVHAYLLRLNNILCKLNLWTNSRFIDSIYLCTIWYPGS